MKFHGYNVIVTNNDFEIFQLSEMTEHVNFIIVSYGQKYLLRNNIFSIVDFLFKFQKIKTLKYHCEAKEKKKAPYRCKFL